MIAQDGHNVHLLKTEPKPFRDTLKGIKNFEYRKNDRNFKTGDFAVLKEYYPDTEKFSNRNLLVHITCVYKNCYGIPEGYCAMGIRALGVDRDV